MNYRHYNITCFTFPSKLAFAILHLRKHRLKYAVKFSLVRPSQVHIIWGGGYCRTSELNEAKVTDYEIFILFT